MDAWFKVRTFVATHLPEMFYDNLFIDKAEPAAAVTTDWEHSS